MKNDKKKFKKKIYLFFLIINFLFFLNFVSAYDWNFSTASDYIYNTTELVVTGGNAYLNGTISAPVYSWWHLNENTGINAGDNSGNNRNGTLMSSPSWVSGKLNNALQFDGTTQWVDFSNTTANFERTQAFSVEFWLKTANAGQQLFLSKMQSTGNYAGWGVYFDGTGTNRIYFVLINIATTNMIRVYCSAGVVADNNWHHLIVTYDGSSNATGVKFYYDGSLKTTGITFNSLTASIQTTIKFQLSGRGGSGAGGINGLLDEIVIYEGVLSADKVTARYNLGNGTETAVGDYPIGYYTIQPKNNFSFSATLSRFNETAIKTGSEIKYSVTTNGTWKYWNNSARVTSNGNWTQSNSASDINSHINTLGNSGNFTFRAVLHSTDGSYTPYLDNIEVQVCAENWIANYTSCNISDKRIKYYYDTNSCGTINDLPIDNGTIESCDYCIPNWFCNKYNNTCINNFFECIEILDGMACCSLTNLTSDCNMATPEIFDMPCGNITQVLNVPSYPYIDFNTSYPIEYIIYLDNTASYIGLISIDIRELTGNISTFNFTYSNSTKSYHLNLFFNEIGNFPFTIYSYEPYVNNLSGMFIVKNPFYITFNFYKTKDLTPYENEFAYVIAELTSSKKYYDTTLEQFMTPLLFSKTFNANVFYAELIDGSATLKLYENETAYAVRVLDGEMTFQTDYSPPNITKSYGTNFFVGKYNLDKTESYNIYLEEKDYAQYRWLFNIVYISLVIVAFITSIFLFFVIPEKPSLSMIFGIGFISTLTLARIIIWIYWG